MYKSGQLKILANFCPPPVVFWTCFERKMPRRTPTTEGDGRRTMRVLKSRVFCRCEINARLCASAPPSFDTSVVSRRRRPSRSSGIDVWHHRPVVSRRVVACRGASRRVVPCCVVPCRGVSRRVVSWRIVSSRACRVLSCVKRRSTIGRRTLSRTKVRNFGQVMDKSSQVFQSRRFQQIYVCVNGTRL